MGNLTKFVADVVILRTVALHRIPLDALALTAALGALQLVACSRRPTVRRDVALTRPTAVRQEALS